LTPDASEASIVAATKGVAMFRTVARNVLPIGIRRTIRRVIPAPAQTPAGRRFEVRLVALIARHRLAGATQTEVETAMCRQMGIDLAALERSVAEMEELASMAAPPAAA
jgi:hypothetical protein